MWSRRTPARVFGHESDAEIALLADLAHHHPRVEAVGQRPHPLHEGQVLGAVARMNRALHVEGVHRGHVRPRLRHGRVRAQFRIVGVEVHGIEPESVHPALEPEPHHLEHAS
jgi:hypothetical protein